MPTRRELLSATALIAAGNVLLKGAVGSRQNPAEQVVDRASSIRITTLEEELKQPQTYRWPGKILKDESIANY